MKEERLFSRSFDIALKDLKTADIAYLALFIAFVAIATLISIALPGGYGYFNLGEVAIYLIALLCGPITGAVVGAVGSALTDIFLGYFIPWAPLTFFIKGVEGYIIGRIGNPLQTKNAIMGVGLGGLWMVFGYGLATGLIYGLPAILPEVIADVGQALVGAVVGIPLAIKLNRTLKKKMGE